MIYLRVDPEVSQKLMTGRYDGDEKKKDIHESNVPYLRSCRAAADYCAQKLGWHSVECIADGKMRGVGEILQDVIRALK